ncbi:MAG: hypothetical protein J2P15_04040 [Micromonosporaceae bacterium]|nr:hypothetical protein [Micromonosporaceae bacterium]
MVRRRVPSRLLGPRLAALFAGMVAVIVLGFGVVPAAAGPTPAAAPSGWSDPLPGYDPGAALPHGPWQAFTYGAAPQLLPLADQDPPKPTDLFGLAADPRKYPYGSRDNLYASWRDKLKTYPASTTPAQLKRLWKTFVKRYVAGVDSNFRGNAYADFVFHQVGIAGSADYQFDKPIPYAPIRPDAFPVNPSVKRAWEVKDTRALTDRAILQLNGYVQAVDATGVQVVYVFRVKPTPKALRLIDAANRRTRFNASLPPGATPLPAIVVRLMPAIPQPIPMANPAPTSTPGTGNAPAKTGGPPPTQPEGGAGIMSAPGSTQLPVDGALADAIADSPDSAADAAPANDITNFLATELDDEDLGADDPLGGVDFSTLELRYVSDSYQGGPGLGYAFSARPAPEGTQSYGGQQAAQLASDAFFVWLALPTSAFTVNLNPDEPDRIMDARFGRTDAGRVLLQADLQMKKSVAKLIHPDTPAGARYWAALQGESKCVSMRQWIVPGPASVREDNGQLYIISAPLQVKLETDYTKTKGVGGTSGCPGQSQAETQHNEAVYRSTILPQVEFAVNHAPEYADLRRVYVSRIAAQWYRERSQTRQTAYSDLIDKGDASDWPLREPWSPQETFDQYVKSYKNGEFKVTHTTRKGNVVQTVTYLYGGVDLSRVPRLKMSGSTFTKLYGQLPGTVSQALYGQTSDAGQGLVWLGGESTARPLPELQLALPSPTSRPSFWIVTLLPLLAWMVGGVLLLLRRRAMTVVR